uniref:Uncharacterized protein n=1 Tax=Romanomermis culicivorax TaxID=13658 RepID=A0A915JK58_ROMCU
MDATARKMETRLPSNHTRMELHRRSVGCWYIMQRGRDWYIKPNLTETNRRSRSKPYQKSAE